MFCFPVAPWPGEINKCKKTKIHKNKIKKKMPATFQITSLCLKKNIERCLMKVLQKIGACWTWGQSPNSSFPRPSWKKSGSFNKGSGIVEKGRCLWASINFFLKVGYNAATRQTPSPRGVQLLAYGTFESCAVQPKSRNAPLLYCELIIQCLCLLAHFDFFFLCLYLHKHFSAVSTSFQWPVLQQ